MASPVSHAAGGVLLIALACSSCIAQAQAGSPSTAAAELGSEAPTSPEVDAPSEARPWYGWQTLIADVVGGVLIASSIAAFANSDGNVRFAPYIVGFMGIGAYGLGAPIVHFAHGNLWGIGSLASHAVVLSVGLTGAARSSCDDQPCTNGIRLSVAGVVLGVGIMAVDAVMAREPREAWRVSVAPWADPRTRAGGLSVASSW